MALVFADLLAEAGLPARETKLLRHDWRGTAAWKRGRDWFGSFISYQSRAASPFATGAQYAAHFLAGPRLQNGSSTAILVAVTQVLGRWPWGERPEPRLWLPADLVADPSREEAVDQAWLPSSLDGHQGLLIDWGYAPRAWHQWGSESPKPIIAGAGQEVLGRAVAAAPLVARLDEAERLRLTVEIEDADIRREVERSPETLERRFEEAQREARPQQGRFRLALLSRHGGACAITDCSVAQALEAAHIVPFAEGRPMRDSPSNGLLLRRDVHKLFDLRLVSIDPADVSVWLHESLRGGHYDALHGKLVEPFASKAALREHFRRRQGA